MRAADSLAATNARFGLRCLEFSSTAVEKYRPEELPPRSHNTKRAPLPRKSQPHLIVHPAPPPFLSSCRPFPPVTRNPTPRKLDEYHFNFDLDVPGEDSSADLLVGSGPSSDAQAFICSTPAPSSQVRRVCSAATKPA